MFQNIDRIYKLSLSSVCWVLLIIAVVYFIKYFYDLFAIIAISLIITYILLWPIKAIENYLPETKKISKRFISTIMSYVLTIVLISVALLLMVQPVSRQLVELSQSFPKDVKKLEDKSIDFINKVSSQYGYTIVENLLDTPESGIESPQDFEHLSNREKRKVQAEILELKFYQQIEKIAKRGAPALPEILLGTFRNIIYIILIGMLSFYFLLNEKVFHSWLKSFFIETHREKYTVIETKIHEALFGYIRGQALLGLLSGLFMWYIYYLFGIKYALVLAILIAIAQFVPIIGPIVAIAPALIIALVSDPLSALFVLIIFSIFQALKDNILVPILLGDMTGLNPVFVIIALVIGERVAGALGVILAVPIASIIKIFIVNLCPPLVNNEPSANNIQTNL